MTPALPLEPLVQLNAATVVSALVSGVIHDLNNGLLVIGGSLELMEDGPLGEEARPRLERIRRQHVAMASRLREFSGVLKPETGGTRADLHAAVAQACTLRETSTRRRGITVRIEADAAVCPVGIAPERLLQIVLNLLLNAEAAVREAQHREIVCVIETDDAGARLRVRDSGPGIDAAVRARLFEAFSSATPATSAGLGLYVSRALAEEAKGSLDLTHDSDGTIATLELPAPAGPSR